MLACVVTTPLGLPSCRWCRRSCPAGLGPLSGAGAGSGSHRLLCVDGSRCRRQVHRLHDGGEIGVHHDGLGLSVADHIRELRGRVRDGEAERRCRRTARSPTAWRRSESREERGKRPGLPRVAAPGEQALGDARRGVEQVAITERALAGDDRGRSPCPCARATRGSSVRGGSRSLRGPWRASAPSGKRLLQEGDALFQDAVMQESRRRCNRTDTASLIVGRTCVRRSDRARPSCPASPRRSPAGRSARHGGPRMARASFPSRATITLYPRA